MTIVPPEPALRDYKDTLTDSRRWDAFTPRDGDIVVSTPPKCGTTWTQAILAMLITGDPLVDAQTSMKSPWIDISFRDVAEVMARLEAQEHRRQVKTHTPFDGVPYWPQMRYITVYRHPIDVHFSFRKHVANMSFDFAIGLYPDDLSEGFRLFLEGDHFDAVSLDSILTHYRETLVREPRENLLRLHYADMTRDLPRTVARIADHVGIEHPKALLDAIADAATFDSMKANAHRFTPSAGQEFWRNDAEFFNTASSNKWEGRLTPDDLAAYDARMSVALSPKDRHWLEWGSA
ncbi:glycolipid sulfotransferase [Antarctobacter heliothermus]|uniref:Glycolipid sulfotransferase n=1 Tax=Antarctobacter heliothermus TaxID=74033 RepID=A0A222E2F3_9RHOB|nr:sulfotransferase domain-containing protein [Antarctobacter heliothermus]ASP20322.1 glycolipid sulfotransferase [Antarctobacter heliothermus]